jgi:hypothetical protein
MEKEESGLQIIEGTGIEVFEAQEKAVLDRQIMTAKANPRNLLRVLENSKAIVVMNKETAESCRYAKPVANKNVTGPSVHLARIICQQYGNIRVQQRIKQITNREIIAEAVAFDLETNYAVSVEARRSIIGKDGRRFSDSVVETNAMGTLAIAERNAILKVIPKSLTDSVYKAAFDFVNGELNDKDKLIAARKKMLDYFAEKYDAKESDVLRILNLRSIGQIGAEQIADLRGYAQSLKDGEITTDELFGKVKVDENPKAIINNPEPKQEPEQSKKPFFDDPFKPKTEQPE